MTQPINARPNELSAHGAPLAALPPLSVTGKKWLEKPTNDNAALALAQQTGLHPLVARLLVQRGFAALDEAGKFLTPRLEYLPDPSELKDMDAAVARIIHAIDHAESIAIFGDYDVDGTCATALLARYFRQLGITPFLYIPHRLTEGYGPTPAAMEDIRNRGNTLLITVDTGTTAHPALEKAKEIGLDVVVTDHHQPSGALPPAAAILNPHRADDTSPLQGLCGSGVAFYLLMALQRALRARGYFASRAEPKLAQLLDLVAIATVCDVMQLTDTNRVLVARGLQQLGTWQNRGLAALASVAGVKETPDVYAAGFAIGPRLNAAGRLESARTALDVLLSDDDDAAYALADQLNSINLQRQQVEKDVLAQAMQQAEEQMREHPLVIVAHGMGWHPGVVGIVAARVKEKFNRPTFVLGGGEDGIYRGSARSVHGLNIGAAVHAAKSHILTGGGHAMAAGVTLNPQKLPEFTACLNAQLQAQLDAAPPEEQMIPIAYRLAPVVHLDATLSLAALNLETAQELEKLAPFGTGNPEPMLKLHNVRVASARAIGKTQEHLKLRLQDSLGSTTVDAVAFGANTNALGPFLSQTAGRAVTLAGRIKLGSWQGQQRVEVHITDAWPA